MSYNDIFIEDNLPEALGKEELLECLKQAKEGNKEARDKAIIHNIRLVLNQVFIYFYNAPYEKKDLASIGNIGLIKAIDTYDIEKDISFSTYATRCINNEIRMFIRKQKKNLKNQSLNQPINYDSKGNELRVEDTILDEKVNFTEDAEKQELLLEIRKQVNMLKDRDKEIIKLYFGFYDDKCYTQQEISTKIGISRPYVAKIIKRTLYLLKSNLEQEKLIEKQTQKNENRKQTQEIVNETSFSKEGITQFLGTKEVETIDSLITLSQENTKHQKQAKDKVLSLKKQEPKRKCKGT